MSNKKKKLLISFGLVALLIGAFFTYKAYRYNDFKRAYENGTTFEQLDVLMNSKRYVKAVREAGYEVDNYDVFMYGMILNLTTKEEPNIRIRTTSDSSAFYIRFTTIYNNQEINVYFELDKNLQIVYQSIEDDSGHDVELDSAQSEELLSMVKEQIENMLKDIYDSMYS